MKDKEEILEYPDFSNVLKNFLNEIEALNETLPMVMALILLKDKQHNKRLDTFIKKSDLIKETTKIKDSADSKDGDEKGTEEDVISLNIEDFIQFEELQKNTEISNVAFKVIPRSLFVSLISQFDAFIGKIIRIIYEIHPEKLNSSEKN